MKHFIATLVLLALPLQCLAAEELGAVGRQQGAAEVESPVVRQLSRGSAVGSGEVVRTGPQARLLIEMTDGTSLALGGNSRVALTPALLENAGAPLRLLEGAFQLTSNNKSLTIATPLGVIGIRGTNVWGGFFSPNDFGVFLFSGKPVTVRTDFGVVTLAPGQGTNLSMGKAPSPPGTWTPARLERAKATVAFD